MTKTIHTDEYKKIANKLKKVRLSSGFTQLEVSRKLNKPQSYISKVENGEQRIDILELKNFAKLYKTSIDYFF